jgi:uncharacterized protein (DUF1697 family)
MTAVPAYAALLRAVNLGPHRKVKMSELRAMVEGAGYTNVATYIQSGNVVFTSRTRSGRAVERDLEQRLLGMTGIDVGVVVRNVEQLDALIENNPFLSLSTDFTKLVVLFLQSPISAAVRRELTTRDFAPEQVAAGEHDVYIHYPNGQGRSKLRLDLLEGVATARNWNTVLRLRELLAETCSP